MHKNICWKSLLPLGASLFALPALCWAQVVFDGSTRSAGAGAAAGDPAFVIDEADGLVRGNTLVHSFSEFSIDSGQDQSATFTGGDNITLLLNRVTGSDPSTINGAITSQLINADFYFLNPNGVIFGPGAAISVPGAFTVSTASRLNIDGENAFDVNGDIANSTLTIADPERLTFIFDNEPASINLQPGANLDNFEDLTLVSSAINAESETIDVGEVIGASLGSGGGTLSIGTSDSEFSFNPGSASSPSGEIRLKDANVFAGGEVGGTVRIIGGELVMDGGELFLRSTAELNQLTASGDIELSNGYSVNLEPLNTGVELQPLNTVTATTGLLLKATNISINGESSINTSTFDTANGLPISLNAESIQLTGGSVIASDTSAPNRGGDIRVSANEIAMRDGASISSLAFQTGNAGDIFLNANQLSLAGDSLIETRAVASAGGNVDIRGVDFAAILGSTVRADAQGALPDNPGANILIDTGSLFFQNAAISANAAGGNGGNITIITNRIIQDPATGITASGNRRIDGNNSVDGLLNEDGGDDIEEEAFSRTTVFPDVTKLLSQRCSAAELTDRSSFVVSGDRQKAAAPTSYELAKVGSGLSVAGLNLMASCFY